MSQSLTLLRDWNVTVPDVREAEPKTLLFSKTLFQDKEQCFILPWDYMPYLQTCSMHARTGTNDFT